MKKTLQRTYNLSEIEKSSDVGIFLKNGIIRRSKSNFVPTTPHFLKVNVLIRFILYSIFDLIEEGDRPFLGLIKEKVEEGESRSKYFRFLYQIIKSDAELYAKKKYTPLEIYIKATSRCKIFYQSDYIPAYGKIMNHFIEIVKRKSEEGHWVSYIKLTSRGKQLQSYYKMGYIF